MALMNLLLQLGFDINYSKVVPPSTSLVFLGININTTRCELALPPEKLTQIRDNVGSYLAKRRASKGQLQSLAGKLEFAAKVVCKGGTFLSRIIECITRLRLPHHRTRIEGAVKADIMYLQRFNEVSTFIEPQPFAPILTDACAAVGGTFLNGDFMYRRWDSDVPSVQDCAINYKEAMIAAISISRR